MGKSLNSRPVGNNPRPTKSLISGTPKSNQSTQQVKQVTPPHTARQSAAPQQTSGVRDLPSSVYKKDEAMISESGLVRFVTMLSDMVSGFSILDTNVIKKNMELAAGNGMSAEDRTVPFECAEYLITNLPYMLMGIVLNENIKDAFLKAIAIELSIDNQLPEVKKKTREGMRSPNPSASVGSIVIGVTSFTKPIEDSFFDKMNATFQLMAPYSADFDEAVAALQTEDKLKFGLIFSNWMYLIRAFTHNDRFFGYIINVVEGVKSTLGLK